MSIVVFADFPDIYKTLLSCSNDYTVWLSSGSQYYYSSNPVITKMKFNESVKVEEGYISQIANTDSGFDNDMVVDRGVFDSKTGNVYLKLIVNSGVDSGIIKSTVNSGVTAWVYLTAINNHTFNISSSSSGILNIGKKMVFMGCSPY